MTQSTSAAKRWDLTEPRHASATPDADSGLSLSGDAVLLMLEVTHRINNEFASLIAIMQRASRGLTDAGAKAVFGEMIDCLFNHAEVHRALAMPERGELIDAADYLGTLCRAISQSKLARRGITLTLLADSQYAMSAQCWMLGMIVSELVTNSARHAFAEAGGDIRVDLRSCGDQMQCCVSDNGAGSAAPSRSPRRSGLKIVERLAMAMAGSIDQHMTGSGARTIIKFPATRIPMHGCVRSFEFAER